MLLIKTIWCLTTTLHFVSHLIDNDAHLVLNLFPQVYDISLLSSRLWALY